MYSSKTGLCLICFTDEDGGACLPLPPDSSTMFGVANRILETQLLSTLLTPTDRRFSEVTNKVSSL